MNDLKREISDPTLFLGFAVGKEENGIVVSCREEAPDVSGRGEVERKLKLSFLLGWLISERKMPQIASMTLRRQERIGYTALAFYRMLNNDRK